MGFVLYDLVAADGRYFSPNCWRTSLALAHKGQTWETRPTRFTEIPAIGGGHKTLPVLADEGVLISDSWRIAEYLEGRFPDRPSLFGDATARRLAWFVQQWTVAQVMPHIFRVIVFDIHQRIDARDQPYFRESREKRLGKTLEAAHAERESHLAGFRVALSPLRLTVGTQPFLGGNAPTYADYVVFGAFQWARMMSPLQLLADDDPLLAWIGRCLDLYDGLARRAPAYWP